MKKNLVLILATLMCISLCACGGSESVSGDNTDKKTEEKEIEITMDNWQEYFEIKEDIIGTQIEKNAFDEIEKINIDYDVIFCLKEEYADKFISVDIALEYIPHNIVVKLFTYNYADDTIESVVTNESDPNPDEEKKTIEITNDKKRLLLSNAMYTETNGDIITFYGLTFPNLEVTRIQGTLTIKE